MAGAVVEDTKLGRETVVNSFKWALSKLDVLKNNERFSMTLEKSASGAITFRYQQETKA